VIARKLVETVRKSQW